MKTKIIPSTDGRYSVTSTGLIYDNEKQRYLTQCVNDKGYKCISLVIEGKRKTKQIHRFVAQAFIENPDDKPQVNHKDGDKTNNHAINLEWSTQSENMKHLHRTRKLKSTGSKRKLKAMDVPVIFDLYFDRGLSQAQIAKGFGVSPKQINNIIRGIRWANVKTPLRHLVEKETKKWDKQISLFNQINQLKKAQ